MDGRPHPDEFAAHTWQGFSTGEWLGQVLKVTTTHLKKGWIRRNGVPRSDQAELTEFFWRHGEYLTWTVIINDPIYLTEPMVRSSDFRWAPGQNVGNYPCQIVTELDHEQGWLPHWLPGKIPYLDLYSKTHDVIPEAARGGAATMLPEFRKKVVAAQKWPPPAQPQDSPGGGGGGGRGGGALPAALAEVALVAAAAPAADARHQPRQADAVSEGSMSHHADSCWPDRLRLAPSGTFVTTARLSAAEAARRHRRRRSEPRSSIRSRRSTMPMRMTERSVPFPFATTSG